MSRFLAGVAVGATAVLGAVALYAHMEPDGRREQPEGYERARGYAYVLAETLALPRTTEGRHIAGDIWKARFLYPGGSCAEAWNIDVRHFRANLDDLDGVTESSC
ncbi:MAG: hypothetical protein ICV64_00495 [Thermoleophilia bacterium]|nr:hypothetical protein [Thermoleophilia bacterium]